MRAVFAGKLPSRRGAYLFSWGIIYAALAGIIHIQTYELTLFVYLFGIAGWLSIVSSFYHKMDAFVFAAISGVAALRALLHLIEFDHSLYFRSLNFTLWAGVAISHFVIARWPITEATRGNGETVLWNPSEGEVNEIKRQLRGE